MNATTIYNEIMETEERLCDALRNDNDSQAEFYQDKLDMLRTQANLMAQELVTA